MARKPGRSDRAKAYDDLAEAITGAQRDLNSALDYARGRDLKVDNSGRVQLSHPVMVPQGSTEHLEPANHAQGIIADALRKATQADTNTARTLRTIEGLTAVSDPKLAEEALTPGSPLAVALALAGGTDDPLSGCGQAGGDRGPKPLTPMPSQVPAGPEYATVDDVVAALAKGGFDCKVTVRNVDAYGSNATCEVQHRGATVSNQISLLSTARFSRDEVGDGIAVARRTYGQTIVAAGNWFIWVRLAVYAHGMAAALPGSVVLEPLGDPAQGAGRAGP
ncbi:hypothetical protein ACIGFK_34135 [Streptomyces sp. NPDC085524]|uniref:hypothetical protein n=1 Tax=Streptomyces sp. NPDC085524 TaxID=3365728 RepID=UPI0037CDDF6E